MLSFGGLSTDPLAAMAAQQQEQQQAAQVAQINAWQNAQQRDAAIMQAVQSGAIYPGSLEMVPIELTQGLPQGYTRAEVQVGQMPFAVMTPNGPMVVPASANLGESIASELGYSLPTRAIVDAMIEQGTPVYTNPQSPGPGMTGYDAVRAQSESFFGAVPEQYEGPVAGGYKNILRGGDFYGWAKPGGGVRQPKSSLANEHNLDYADYSHAFRPVGGVTLYDDAGNAFEATPEQLQMMGLGAVNPTQVQAPPQQSGNVLRGQPTLGFNTAEPIALQIFNATRADYPSSGGLNISMDFNASPGGGARGTEVIIPDNASPELRAAAERFNQGVRAFAAQNGIPDYPIRGVRTRSENGRGVSNTVHVEPFFNDDLEMQQLIQANPAAFAAIYRDAFGGIDGRLIAPHGVENDRGATSPVFGDETSYGQLIAQTLLGGDVPPMRSQPAQRSGGDFRTRLAMRESGGDPSKVNTLGYTGTYQFGQARLDDFNRANGTNLTLNDLRRGALGMKPGDLQEKVADWHFADIDKAIDALGTDMNRDGLRAVAHLGGVGGMRRFVESGGQYNPADAYGTRLSDYYNEFSQPGSGTAYATAGSPAPTGGPQRAGNALRGMSGGYVGEAAQEPPQQAAEAEQAQQLAPPGQPMQQPGQQQPFGVEPMPTGQLDLAQFQMDPASYARQRRLKSVMEYIYGAA